MKGTGSGEYYPLRKFSEEEQTIVQNIVLSIDGMPNWYGNDQRQEEGRSMYLGTVLEESAVDDPAVVIDWSNYSPTMLQTTKHQSLQTATVNDSNVELGTLIVESVEEVPVTLVQHQPPSTSIATTTQNALDVNTATGNVMVVKKVHPKQRTGHKNVKTSPFEQLVIKKQKLIDCELELVELKKTHAIEVHNLTIKHMIEEHEWKKASYFPK